MNNNVIAIAMTQLTIKEGIKKLKERGIMAPGEEMRQRHNQSSFDHKHPHELTEKQREEALRALVFLKEKRDGRVKARR